MAQDLNQFDTDSGFRPIFAPLPPGPVTAPQHQPGRGQGWAVQARLARVRQSVAEDEARAGVPALSLGSEGAGLVSPFVRAIDRDTRMGGLGPGERLYAFIHAVHADHAGADRVGMARVGALMGVNTDSVTDYHRAVEACGAISAQRTRRQDGRRGGYRTVVSAIAEAATREGGRRMGPRECGAIVSRWALALLSDRDMEPLGPDDRWRVVQLAAGYPDGVFLASRADLAALWGLGVRTAAGVVRRLRTAGVLSGSQHSRRAGVPSTRWSIVPVAAAVETASTAFDMLATQRVSAAHPCDADIPGGTAPPPRRSARS